MEILNNMFATPELADLEINSEKFINIQKAIQSAIDEIIPVILPETSNIDFVTMDLVQLGNKRRHFTRNALRKIIIRILIGKEPGINLDGTCCLIGLFMSTKYPVFHTTTTKTGDRSTCTLTKQNDSNTVYRSFNGEFFEVDPGNVDIRKNYLVLQLL
ncbi:uncharacterized protein LOC126835840 [Adelges cooleyi]|uniref:uncharacterized protein LOC126835840 n=1 Tax=Adelges cooleyi TaxID=133065 RepID=UPI00217FEDC5|nr:uncharacterized protein LOC126835840 [Adelges cooleyi]